MAAARDFYRSGNDFTVLFDHKTDFAQSDSSFGGAQMRNVSVLLSHEYDNKPADPEFESEKASVWESRKAKTPGLFNGSKFRFNGLECKKNHLSLYLGLTDYKDYVCTNMNEDKWQYLAKISGELYGDQQTCFAHPLGVGAVVVSRDNQVLFIRRSHMVYEAPGMVDVPGGHPEPSEVKHIEGNGGKLNLEQVDPEAVVHELYDSIIREVRDEVNIPECCMSQPVLLGIFRNHTTGGRPGLCFLINCTQNGDEIYENYQQGCPEAFESTELLLVPTLELRMSEQPCEVNKLVTDLTPGCKACLYFYVGMMNDTNKTKQDSVAVSLPTVT